jgi:hypothetical protein
MKVLGLDRLNAIKMRERPEKAANFSQRHRRQAHGLGYVE